MNNYYCCCISSSSLTIKLSTVVKCETRRCLCGLSFASLSISHTLLTFLEWYRTNLTYYKSMRQCGVPQRQENENSHCMLYGPDHEILVLCAWTSNHYLNVRTKLIMHKYWASAFINFYTLYEREARLW